MCICMGGDCTYAKIGSALVFKGHSLGISSIASKKCTVAFAYAGRATRWAVPRFLVYYTDLRISQRKRGERLWETTVGPDN